MLSPVMTGLDRLEALALVGSGLKVCLERSFVLCILKCEHASSGKLLTCCRLRPEVVSMKAVLSSVVLAKTWPL